MLSLRAHGIFDYAYGALLALSPFLFGFASIDVARNVFTLSAVMLTLYSLFTNYHAAVLRVIPLGVHMVLDTLAGVFLVSAPWIFGYRPYLSSTQEYAHYAFGLGIFALVGMTREKTESDKRAHHVRVRATPSSSHA